MFIYLWQNIKYICKKKKKKKNLFLVTKSYLQNSVKYIKNDWPKKKKERISDLILLMFLDTNEKTERRNRQNKIGVQRKIGTAATHRQYETVELL